MILKKKLESMISAPAINNGDLVSPDVWLNMTPKNTFKNANLREPSSCVITFTNFGHKNPVQ